MFEDKKNCPECNYPGVVTKGLEKGFGPYFGIYIPGEICSNCQFKEKVPKKPKVKSIPIAQQPEYQNSLSQARESIWDKLSEQNKNLIARQWNQPLRPKLESFFSNLSRKAKENLFKSLAGFFGKKE